MMVCTQCGRELSPSRAAEATTCPECETQSPALERGRAPSAEPHTSNPVLTTRTPVPLTAVLVGINVLVFIAMVVKGASVTQPTADQILRWGANFGPLTLTGQWWRLLTAMFVHIGLVHLALNMWCLWELGLLAEYLYGPKTFLALYLMSGLAASIVSLARNPLVVTAGASGAIFGLAGALIATLYLGKLAAPRGRMAHQPDQPGGVRRVQPGLRICERWHRQRRAYRRADFRPAAGIGAEHGFSGSKRRASRASGRWCFPHLPSCCVAGAAAVRYAHMPVVRLEHAEQQLRQGDTAGAMRELTEVVKASAELRAGLDAAGQRVPADAAG